MLTVRTQNSRTFAGIRKLIPVHIKSVYFSCWIFPSSCFPMPFKKIYYLTRTSYHSQGLPGKCYTRLQVLSGISRTRTNPVYCMSKLGSLFLKRSDREVREKRCELRKLQQVETLTRILSSDLHYSLARSSLVAIIAWNKLQCISWVSYPRCWQTYELLILFIDRNINDCEKMAK